MNMGHHEYILFSHAASNSDGLQPNSDGLRPNSNGPNSVAGLNALQTFVAATGALFSEANCS